MMIRRLIASVLVMGVMGMAVAPQVMAWQRRMAATPGPLMPGGVATRGIPFLPDELGSDARWGVLFGFGADVTTDPAGWPMTDVSADILNEREILIYDGRQNEQGQAQPARLSLTLKNFQGQYTPRRQTGPHFPYVRVGVPLEVFVNTGASGEQAQFTGFIDGIYPRWDETGLNALVDITAKGVLSRLDQGTPPALSPLERANLAGAEPDYLWMMDDAATATEAAEANGGPALTVNTTGTVTFGVVTPPLLAGASQYVTATNTAGLTGATPDLPSTGFFAVSAWFAWPGAAVDATVLGPVTGTFDDSGTAAYWNLDLYASGPPGFNFKLFNSVPTSLGSLDSGTRHDGGTSVGVDPFDGSWHNVFVTVQNVGASIVATMWVDGLLADRITIASQSVGVHTDFVFANIETGGGTTGTLWIGPFAVYSDADAASPNGAVRCWDGEGCWTRFLRLLDEEGIPGAISTGATSGGRPMGPQPTATIGDLLRQCEAVDGGVMVDG